MQKTERIWTYDPLWGPHKYDVKVDALVPTISIPFTSRETIFCVDCDIVLDHIFSNHGSLDRLKLENPKHSIINSTFCNGSWQFCVYTIMNGQETRREALSIGRENTAKRPIYG